MREEITPFCKIPNPIKVRVERLLFLFVRANSCTWIIPVRANRLKSRDRRFGAAVSIRGSQSNDINKQKNFVRRLRTHAPLRLELVIEGRWRENSVTGQAADSAGTAAESGLLDS